MMVQPVACFWLLTSGNPAHSPSSSIQLIDGLSLSHDTQKPIPPHLDTSSQVGCLLLAEDRLLSSSQAQFSFSGTFANSPDTVI